MPYKIYHHPDSFPLQRGGVLKSLTLAYNTFGHLNERRDNVVWVCHALTANSDVADWWLHTVESGCFLDPDRWFIVCVNIPGSCYGSTGPLSINPETGEPYYEDFPKLSIRDVVNALRLVADHLGIKRIHALVGSSVGGFQAMEWAAMEPERFEKLVFMATAPYASPWNIALNETQRMAIHADASWGARRSDAGAAGLAAARAIGLLSYRGPEGYNLTQQDRCLGDTVPDDHRACSYQRYQGEKLVNRFDAYSYLAILDTFDTHDIGRGRGGRQCSLDRIANGGADILVIGLSTDLVFTPAEMKELHRQLPGSRYEEIDSPFGHDGFLVEHEKLNSILVPFLNS